MNDSVNVLEYVARRDPHNVETHTFEKCVSSDVTSWLIVEVLPLPINFHDLPALKTGEVNGDRADRELPAKLQAGGAPTQRLPEEHFGQAQFAA